MKLFEIIRKWIKREPETVIQEKMIMSPIYFRIKGTKVESRMIIGECVRFRFTKQTKVTAIQLMAGDNVIMDVPFRVEQPIMLPGEMMDFNVSSLRLQC